MSRCSSFLVVILLPSMLLAAPPKVDLQGDPLPEGAVARIGTVRLRHGGRITALAFSPDGKTLASAGEDRRISLWDIATGKELRRIELDRLAQRARVLALVFTAKGMGLLSWDEQGPVRHWELSSGKIKTPPSGWPERVAVASFSADGNLVAMVKATKPGEQPGKFVASVWDLTAGKVIREVVPPEGITTLTLSPRGRYLSAGVSRQAIPLWDVDSGKELHRLPQLEDLLGLQFSKDEKTLFISQHQRTMRRDVASGAENGPEIGHSSWAERVLIPGEGKALLHSHSARAAVHFCEPATKWREFVSHVQGVSAMALSPDGKTLATGGDQCIRLWDASSGKERPLTEGKLAGDVWARFLTDGKLAMESRDRILRFHDPLTGKELRRLPPWPQGRVLDLSPDCKLAAVSGNYQSSLRIIDLSTGKEVRRLERPFEDVFMVCEAAFSPDGRNLAVVSDEGRQMGLRRWPSYFLRLWDVSTGKVVRELAKPTGFGGNPLVFAPDGQTLAMSTGTWLRSDNRLWLWNVGTGERLKAPPPEQLGYRLSTFSPDSRFLALWGDVDALDLQRIPRLDGTAPPLKPEKQAVHVWELATGKEVLAVSEPGREPSCVCFSRSGRFLVLGFAEGDLVLWDVPLGKLVRRLRGHRGPIGSLSFSIDGRLLVSGSEDVTAVVWDVVSLLRPPALPRQELDAKKLASLWTDLAGDDAIRGYAAVRILAGSSEKSLPLLREHLRPVPPIPPERLARLLADLDSDRFTIRNRAMEDLRRLERMAEPAMRKALDDKPTLDARRRIEQLLGDLDKPSTGPDQLRQSRALLTLEYDGTQAAQELLKRLSQGAPGAWLTERARAGLQRQHRGE
jgi:WD40 repeat protein